MENAPAISIAMCTYNGSAFLPEQLNSILNQGYRNWELIIVDDCSTDGTVGILEDYAARDARITIYRNEQNLGYNRNFEKALQLCKHKLIAISDQDDIWHPDKLQKQVDRMGDNQLVYHDSEFMNARGERMNRKISDKLNFYRGNRPEVFLYLNCVSGHSIMIKKPVLYKSLPFPVDFHYDHWLAFNAANMGSIDFVDEPLVRYRQHSSNNTDILALHPVEKTTKDKVVALETESRWLLLCAGQAEGRTHQLISALYDLSIRRNSGFLNFRYGALIWQNKDILLRLLKKTDRSKFFYTIRKMWGAKAKMIAN